jgi:hypothetical protein
MTCLVSKANSAWGVERGKTYEMVMDGQHRHEHGGGFLVPASEEFLFFLFLR